MFSKVSGIGSEALPIMSWRRVAGAIAHLALILSSSTKIADDFSQFAYSFYMSSVETPGPASESVPHHLAEKSIHFVLFFSFGTWICNSLPWASKRRLWLTILTCLFVGSASEVLQRFTGRDPSIADVVLNLSSGTLAAALTVLNADPIANKPVLAKNLRVGLKNHSRNA